MIRKLYMVSAIMMYLGVGVMLGAAILLMTENLNWALGIGGLIAIVAVGIYAYLLWRHKDHDSKDTITNIVKTAIGVNYEYLQTDDMNQFVNVRDKLAELIATKVKKVDCP